MVVSEASKAREPTSSKSDLNFAKKRMNPPISSVAATIAAVVSSYTTTTAFSDCRQARPTLQSNNNKSLSKSSSMILSSSTLKKSTNTSTKKSIAKNDSTMEDNASCRVPPSPTTTASTILGVVGSMVESCESGVPLEVPEMDAFLAATGRLHTLMLGPDLNVKACILSSVLGMDPEVWACEEVPSSLSSSPGTTPTSRPACSVPGVLVSRTTLGQGCGKVKPLDCLLKVLQGCSDPLPTAAVCALLHQLLSPDNREELRGFVLSSLVSGRAMDAILWCLFRVQDSGGQTAIDAVTLPAYQVMAKLAVKDSRGLVRFRLLGGVLLTHRLLQDRLPPHPDAQTLPLLMVLRAISKNGSNQQLLGRDGCVLTLTRMLALTPKSHATKLKYILDILALLTNNKNNVAKCIRDGALSHVIQVLEHWQQYDIKVLPKIIRPVVALLGHVAETKKGRQVLDEAGAVSLLEQFVLNCPDQKHLDLAVGFASTLYIRCRGGSSASLPGTTAFPAITFTLPDEIEETNSVEDELIMESSTQPQFNSNAFTNTSIQTPSAYMSDDDEDDDNDDDEVDENNDTSTTTLPGVGEPCSFFFPLEDASKADGEAGGFPSLQMPMEELLKFSTFFPELRPHSVAMAGDQEFDYWKNISDPGKDPSSASSLECYQRLSSLTRSLVPFVKLAHPDLSGASSPRYLEPLYDKQPRMARTVALQRVQRAMRGGALHRVVFDLDSLLQAQRAQQRITPLANTQRPLSNWDEKRVGRRDVSTPYLNFESRFESGNLRRAVQVEEREYELVLNCDVSSRQHHQWFYFEVSNMEAGVPYVFSIINNEKPGSEFNAGMKPLLYSVKDAMHGRNYWVRTGTNIFYHRNHYTKAHPPRNPNNRYSNTSSNGDVATTSPANDKIGGALRNDDSFLPHQNMKNGLSPAAPCGTVPDSRIEDITLASPNSVSNTTCWSEPSPPNLSKNSNNASEGNAKTIQGSGTGAGRGAIGNNNYYTASFTIIFPHSYDVCYLAYHYPYSYTNLQRFLSSLRQQSLPLDTFFSCQTLCRSLNGNPVPVITITSKQAAPTSKSCSSTAKQSVSASTDSLNQSPTSSVPLPNSSVPPSSTSSSSQRSSLKCGVPAKRELREQQNTLDSLDCDSLSNNTKESTHRDDIDAVSVSFDSTSVDSFPDVTSDKNSVVVEQDNSQVKNIVCDNVDVVKNSSVVDNAKNTFNDDYCIVDRNFKSAEVSNETHSKSVLVDNDSHIVIVDNSDGTALQNNDAKLESSKKSVVDVSSPNKVKSIAIKYSDLFADDGSCKVKVATKTGAGIRSVNRNCDNIKRNFDKFNEMSNTTKISNGVSRRRIANKCDVDAAVASDAKTFTNTNNSVSGCCSNNYTDKTSPSEQLSTSIGPCPPMVEDAYVPSKTSEYPQTPSNEDTPDFSTAVAVEDMWSKLTGTAPPLVAAATEGGDAATDVEDSSKMERREESLQSVEVDQSSYNRVKPVVFLSSRVHPGETNASWIMQGSLAFLLSDTAPARALRERYVFKVVPMLNPEGVIHGNTRCGLTAEDLNRRWRAPSPRIHPTIYNTKALLEYLTRIVSKRDYATLSPPSSASQDSQSSVAKTCASDQDDADAGDDWLALWGASDDGDTVATAGATKTSTRATATPAGATATPAGSTATSSGATATSAGYTVTSVAATMTSVGATMTSVGATMTSVGATMTSVRATVTSAGATMTSEGDTALKSSNVNPAQDPSNIFGDAGKSVPTAASGTNGAASASNVVRVFCDYHGHSRQKNLFLYGCSRQLSWRVEDNEQPDNQDLMELPQQCQRSVPAFSGRNCCYTVESHREATARVTVWRQCAIPCSYTLEASACGCDQGLYQGYHLGTRQLLESGARFCQSLLHLRPGDWDVPLATGAASTEAGVTNGSVLQAASHHPSSEEESLESGSESDSR